MQSPKQATFKQYVLAGNTLLARERIIVSTHVSLDNPGEQDSRELFVAKEEKRAGLSISYKWAAIALLFCFLLGLGMMGNRTALTKRMHGEYSQLNARFQAAQAEENRLMDLYLEKSDASAICYYAVQSLGMRLAGHQETIGVQAAGLPVRMNTQNMLGSASNGH